MSIGELQPELRKAHIASLEQLLRDQDETVRRAACETIGKCTEEERATLMAKIVWILRRDESEAVREAALLVMASASPRERATHLSAIHDMVSDDDAEVRWAACEVLATFTDQERAPCMDTVLERLRGEDWRVRYLEARLLQRIAEAEAETDRIRSSGSGIPGSQEPQQPRLSNSSVTEAVSEQAATTPKPRRSRLNSALLQGSQESELVAMRQLVDAADVRVEEATRRADQAIGLAEVAEQQAKAAEVRIRQLEEEIKAVGAAGSKSEPRADSKAIEEAPQQRIRELEAGLEKESESRRQAEARHREHADRQRQVQAELERRAETAERRVGQLQRMEAEQQQLAAQVKEAEAERRSDQKKRDQQASVIRQLEIKVIELEGKLRKQQQDTRRQNDVPRMEAVPKIAFRSEMAASAASPLSARSCQLDSKSARSVNQIERPSWNKCTLTEAEAAAKKSRSPLSAAFYIPEAPRAPMCKRPATADATGARAASDKATYLNLTAACKAKRVPASAAQLHGSSSAVGSGMIVRNREGLEIVRSGPGSPDGSPVKGFGSSTPRIPILGAATSTPGVGHYDLRSLSTGDIGQKMRLTGTQSFNKLPRFAP